MKLRINTDSASGNSIPSKHDRVGKVIAQLVMTDRCCNILIGT